MADYGVSGLGCKIQGLQFRSLGYGATMALKLAKMASNGLNFFVSFVYRCLTLRTHLRCRNHSLPLQYKSVETTVVSDKFVHTYLVILKLP